MVFSEFLVTVHHVTLYGNFKHIYKFFDTLLIPRWGLTSHSLNMGQPRRLQGKWHRTTHITSEVQLLKVIEFLHCLPGHLLREPWASEYDSWLPWDCHAKRKPKPHRKATGRCSSWHSQPMYQVTTSISHQTCTWDTFRWFQPAAIKHPSLRIFPEEA